MLLGIVGKGIAAHAQGNLWSGIRVTNDGMRNCIEATRMQVPEIRSEP